MFFHPRRCVCRGRKAKLAMAPQSTTDVFSRATNPRAAIGVWSSLTNWYSRSGTTSTFDEYESETVYPNGRVLPSLSPTEKPRPSPGGDARGVGVHTLRSDSAKRSFASPLVAPDGGGAGIVRRP